MRKEVLGLLACVASGSLAYAQYEPGNNGAGPGEPIPLQAQLYPPAGAGAYASPFPSYAPPSGQDGGAQASPPYGVPYVTPQSNSPYSPAAKPGPAYPSPMPQLPGYGPAPFGPGPAPFPGMPSQGTVPGMLTSQGIPPATAPAPPARQAPPPEYLPNAPRPSATTRTPGSIPSEPYLVAESKGGGNGEPYFQQVDPWRAVRGSRMYGSLDYLLWWTKQQSVPSVSTLPNVDLASQLGTFNNDPRSGVRATFGSWITPMKNLAWEASYFFLGDQLVRNTLALPASAPNVATLPFFFGIDSQSSQVTVASHLWGADTSLRYQLCCFKTDEVQWFVDVLGGFRYMDLSEGIGVQTNSQFTPAPVLLSGASVTSVDNFFTHNNFYGGQLGAETNVYWWRLNVNVFGKVALGDNVETVNVSGFTTVVAPLASQLLTGGFLTQPSNIGHHTANVFAVIPEVGVNLNFRVCHYCQLGVGYSFLYFSRVARPGDQISPVTNGSALPAGLGGTTPQPAFSLQQSHFWADGVNARIMFIF
jgi:hypothetical protein